MKKTLLLILVGLLTLAVSCTEDHKTILKPDNFSASEWIKGDNGSIFPQGDEITLVRGEAENIFGTLAWSETDLGYNAALVYSIQVALEPEDGTAKWQTVAQTSATEYEVSVKDFNEWLITGGAQKAKTNDMLIRVSASISSSYDSICSEIYQFKAKVFSTDPDRVYFVSRNGSTDNSDYALAPDFNSRYNGFVNIPDGTEGIWLVEDINPDVRWGIETSSTAQGAKLNLKKESEGGHAIMPGAFGSGDIEASFTDKGYYRVSVNIDNTAGTGTIEIWRFYGDFFICGQQNNNIPTWSDGFSKQHPGNPKGTGAKLTYYPEERIWRSETVYVPTGKTSGSGTEITGKWDFKFRANHGSGWGNAVNGGGQKGNSDEVKDGVQSGQVIVTKGNNIKFNGEEGWYYWEVDLSKYPDYNYRMIPAKAPESAF